MKIILRLKYFPKYKNMIFILSKRFSSAAERILMRSFSLSEIHKTLQWYQSDRL